MTRAHREIAGKATRWWCSSIRWRCGWPSCSQPHVERQGFELVSVEYHKGTRSSLLRLLMDRPGGGIALSDLERLSPVLSDLLDVYDPIDGRYTLEVASPGVNRPLTRRRDFEAFVGQRVRIKTHRAVRRAEVVHRRARVGGRGRS